MGVALKIEKPEFFSYNSYNFTLYPRVYCKLSERNIYYTYYTYNNKI